MDDFNNNGFIPDQNDPNGGQNIPPFPQQQQSNLYQDQPQQQTYEMPQQQPYQAPSVYSNVPQENGKGLAIAALILSILGLVLFFWCNSWLFALPALICSITAKRKGNQSTMNKIALILSIIGIVIGVVTFVLNSIVLVPYINQLAHSIRK